MNALALRLAEQGRVPTQIHFDGKAPEQWDWNSQEARVFSWADEAYVVTQDGQRHNP